MTNKVLLISASYAAALLLAATSCVKDELHDTPHPDYGKITVTADWTDRGDDVNIPAEWTVTVRLLGITGNTQTLTATLTYADGNPQPTGLESDLTAALADFNADKTVPLTLGGEAVVPDEAGVTATIDDWQPGNDGGEDVNIH